MDCVLQFEGERERTYRTLRALKNRFGSTSEVGVFEMRDSGLVEVRRRVGAVRGRGHARAGLGRAVRDGGIPPAAGGGPGAGGAHELVPPRRVANGVDRNRLALVLAVLARHGACARQPPTFRLVAGGVRVDEPGADLAIALALASASRGVASDAERARGGVRRARAHGRAAPGGSPDRRLAEARKFGLAPCCIPAPRSARWPHALRGGAGGAGRLAHPCIIQPPQNVVRH